MCLGVDDSDDDDVPQVDLTAERWSVRQDARKNLYTGKTYNSVENVAQFFKERGVTTPLRPTSQPTAVVRTPLSRPVPKQAGATPKSDERMPWDGPVIQQNRPVVVPASKPVAPPNRPVQGGLFGSEEPADAPRPAQLIPPIQARTNLPKVPAAPIRPAQTGTVVEHPKYGKGTVVRREGNGDDAKVTVMFQRHGMKKLVEKYAGLKKA